MREIRQPGSMRGGVETEVTAGLLRHRQTKEAETVMSSLKPPRHISTLPTPAKNEAAPISLFVRWSSREFLLSRARPKPSPPVSTFGDLADLGL